MAKYEYTAKYDIEDIVYSINGDKGIVCDISHQVSTGKIKYLVVFGRLNEDSVWCLGLELSKDKVII